MDKDLLLGRASQLRLWGLVAHWDEIAGQTWAAQIINWQEEEHQRRSLEYRTGKAKLGKYRVLADFDWKHPKKIDREQVEELFTLEFMQEAANVVLMGPNGVGKTIIAQNLGAHALVRGHQVGFVEASHMLGELDACEGATALERVLAKYTRPHLLIVDEVGYLNYGNRHADLLFEVVNRRYERRSTIVTTNRPFAEWNQVFPNAACVVTLLDRLLHRAEVIKIDGDSYRAKEAQQRADAKRRGRKGSGKPKLDPEDPS